LAEEVIGDSIVIYAQNPEEALHLVAHGFSEWLLNTHSRPYRDMINKSIELFEHQQYQRKERLIAALERLFEKRARVQTRTIDSQTIPPSSSLL
jgi:hypothetical protein